MPETVALRPKTLLFWPALDLSRLAPNARFSLAKLNNYRPGQLLPMSEFIAKNKMVAGYHFFNRFILLPADSQPVGARFITSQPLPIEAVAALAMKNALGDNVSWQEDQSGKITQVTARFKSGLTVTLKGSDLVTAAVYLTRINEQLLKRTNLTAAAAQHIELSIESEPLRVVRPWETDRSQPHQISAARRKLDEAIEKLLKQALPASLAA
jgi:hypothetical protein